MKLLAPRLVAHAIAVGGTFVLLAGEATCQERVALIRPVGVDAISGQVRQRFERSIREAVPDVIFVTSIGDASAVVELARYAWSTEEEYGVRESWRFYYLSLDPSADVAAGRGRQLTLIVGQGRTLAECGQDSSEKLRNAFARLLPQFRTWVPK